MFRMVGIQQCVSVLLSVFKLPLTLRLKQLLMPLVKRLLHDCRLSDNGIVTRFCFVNNANSKINTSGH